MPCKGKPPLPIGAIRERYDTDAGQRFKYMKIAPNQWAKLGSCPRIPIPEHLAHHFREFPKERNFKFPPKIRKELEREQHIWETYLQMKDHYGISC